MEQRIFKKETREEYEARKARQNEQEEARKEDAKEMGEMIMKANQCPKCKKAQLRKFSRKNYPFGKKSKTIVTSGKKCPNCDYVQIDTNGKK